MMIRKFAVLVVVLVVGCAVQADLLNPSFETGTGQGGYLPSATVDNWTHYGDGWWADDPGAVYDGSWAIKRWTSGAGMYQDFTASENTSYALSLWAYDSSAEALVDRRLDLQVEWFDAGDVQIGSSVTIGSLGAGGSLDTWTELSDNVMAPGTTAKGRFVIKTEDDGASPGGSVYFDLGSAAEAIPEPTTLILLSSAFGVLLLRRRMHRQS